MHQRYLPSSASHPVFSTGIFTSMKTLINSGIQVGYYNLFFVYLIDLLLIIGIMGFRPAISPYLMRKLRRESAGIALFIN